MAKELQIILDAMEAAREVEDRTETRKATWNREWSEYVSREED